jgi:magnesium transporter
LRENILKRLSAKEIAEELDIPMMLLHYRRAIASKKEQVISELDDLEHAKDTIDDGYMRTSGLMGKELLR